MNEGQDTKLDVTLSLVNSLLSQARVFATQDKVLERTQASRFNLFHICGVAHYEVTTHSSLLATLLDPKGTHGQGPIFLKRFIEMDEIKQAPGFPKDFDPETATVDCEVSIGQIIENQGGRIDILLCDQNNRKIAIENKIYAVEQPNWVERYCNYIKNDGCLLYLNLQGNAPKEVRPEKIKEQLATISYARTIKAWLGVCRKEAAMVPIVRESLTQYIHLIDTLTNQNSNPEMNDQISQSVIADAPTFDAYIKLRNANQSVRDTIIKKFTARIKDKLSTMAEIVCLFDSGNNMHNGIVLATPAFNDCNAHLVISFDGADYRDCYFGFKAINKDKAFGSAITDIELLRESFISVFQLPPNSNNVWPAWYPWVDCRSWDDEMMRRICFEGDSFDRVILNKVTQLLKVQEEFLKRRA